MWHQSPTFNRATVGTRRWMGQESAEAVPASGFRHLLGGKKEPWPGWDFGQLEGFGSRPARVTWVSRMAGQGHVDRAIVGPGWDISWAGATFRLYQGWRCVLWPFWGRG